MNLSSQTISIILALCVLAIAIQAVWIFRKHDTHRLRRLLGIGLPGERGGTLKVGRFYWKEGVFESEITRAMSEEYGRKNRWLLSHANQRRIVALVVASWLLNLLGAFDLSWNLGFGDSLFSWWSVLAVATYMLLRQSVRALADAPTELIDERLARERDSAYRSAYRLLGWLIPLAAGLAYAATDAGGVSLTLDHAAFGLLTFGLLFEGLPSIFIAWRGGAREID